MIAYFTRHPTAANILMMAIIALGLYALSFLNRETFPDIKPDSVRVTIAYPGASSADVEDAICNPLENATDGVSYLSEQLCDARDSIAFFTLKMLEAGDINEFMDDINAAVDGISNFPDQAEEPVVQQLGRTSVVATLAVTSKDLTPSELKALTEYYRDKLLAQPGIPMVDVSGFSTHQLQVLIAPDALRKYRLNVSDIANLITAQATDLPAGSIESDTAQYQVRFENARRTAAELEDLVILSTPEGGEIRLGEIARVVDRFENPEDRVELNGDVAGLLTITKNTTDDSLRVFGHLETFVAQESAHLPEGTRLTITQDAATIVSERLQLLLKNGWQGLLLATLSLMVFFSWRYAFWVAVGLPVSFLGGLALMVVFGVSINMISMVALLMAIGILMDDAIVLSEAIAHEYGKGKTALQAAIDGAQRVVSGILASFTTSACLFGSLLLMEGELGQVLGVIPIVLLSVLSISLIEAFLILPHHLLHSLEHASKQRVPRWRTVFEQQFARLREGVGRLADTAIAFRYVTVGLAIALLIGALGLMMTGVVKFKSFPDTEGNRVEARVLLSQRASLAQTIRVMERVNAALEPTVAALQQNESATLIENRLLQYGVHGDVPESGGHLATLSLDLLKTEHRNTTIAEFIEVWRSHVGELPGALNLQFREPTLGPSGRAIEIRLSGQRLDRISAASWELQTWLQQYRGVSNVLDDLRPGMPQFSVTLKPGALTAGFNATAIASELRAAYQGTKIDDVYHRGEPYEIVAKLDNPPGQELATLDAFALFINGEDAMPLHSVANVTEQRAYSRIARIDHVRTVTIVGDVDADIANTSEIAADTRARLLPALRAKYPDVTIAFKGEIESGNETGGSIVMGFFLGALGVFFLLSFIFRNYREPALVMVNIPLALIGAIGGHWLMGLDFSLPSMIGFVSLAGIVVNDSILLVIYIKRHFNDGLSFHESASLAVRDRFRAILLTSVTTVAGMTPLLFETSRQAAVLIPLVTSVVFGMITSTLLIMLVLPSIYAILEDFGAAGSVLAHDDLEKPSAKPAAGEAP